MSLGGPLSVNTTRVFPTIKPAKLGSVFDSQLEDLVRISSYWMERLRSLVEYEPPTFLPRYDLSAKHLVINEVTTQSEPESYKGRERIAAELLYCENERGVRFNPMTNEVRIGDFSKIVVEMLTSNWGQFQQSKFELYLVHEIRHVTNPTLNFILGAWIFEDQQAMYEETLRLIRMFGIQARDARFSRRRVEGRHLHLDFRRGCVLPLRHS